MKMLIKCATKPIKEYAGIKENQNSTELKVMAIPHYVDTLKATGIAKLIFYSNQQLLKR